MLTGGCYSKVGLFYNSGGCYSEVIVSSGLSVLEIIILEIESKNNLPLPNLAKSYLTKKPLIPNPVEPTSTNPLPVVMWININMPDDLT